MPIDNKENRDRVAALGCIVCRSFGHGESPAAIHHVRRGGGKRSNAHIIPLCPSHHQTGGYGVAIHSGRSAWEGNWGNEIDYIAKVDELI